MTASASTLRRIAVAIQTVATLATAFALHHWTGWPAGVAVASATTLYIALFAIAVGAAFAITHYGIGIPATCRPRADNVPPPRSIKLSPIALCACWLRECLSVWWLFNVTQPFFAHRPFERQPAPAQDPGRTPLLLIHGYACNHAVWLGMQRHLTRAGYPCEALDLIPVLGDIDDYGHQIATRAAVMQKRHGRPPILICHSMGGLAARAAIRLCRATDTGAPTDVPTDLPFAHIVTLGTPHHGSALAQYGQGRNAEQMRCGSAWLTALAAAETTSERALVTSIFSWHDSIVGPRGTTWLDGAHHIPLRGLGHVSLLTHPDVAACVLDRLATLEAPHRTVM